MREFLKTTSATAFALLAVYAAGYGHHFVFVGAALALFWALTSK
jgi:cytochrome c biogenesis protein CcdA